MHLIYWGRWTPYGTTKCIICKQQVHQNGKYCHTCAYTKGSICWFWTSSICYIGCLITYLACRYFMLTCFFFFFCSGVCAMCGKQVLDTKYYKQSNVWYKQRHWYFTLYCSFINVTKVPPPSKHRSLLWSGTPWICNCDPLLYFIVD